MSTDEVATLERIAILFTSTGIALSGMKQQRDGDDGDNVILW